MTLEICPSCKNQDSIFVAHFVAIGLDGKLYGGRVEAFCNNMQCDQRYWYHPKTGRVTRRNVGLTYEEWHQRRYALQIVDVQTAVGPEAVDEVLAECPPPQNVALRQRLYEKWCWVRAFFVVYVLGFKRFSACVEEDYHNDLIETAADADKVAARLLEEESDD